MIVVDKLKIWLIPNLAYIILVLINKSLNLQVVGAEKIEAIADKGPLLFSAWHRYTWIPVYYLRNRGYYALTSNSRDGEYMTRLMEKLGWRTIRGSSTRGGGRSLLKLYRRLRRGASTALTPDGPTGPIYRAKPGIVFLQEKTGGYIIPLGVAVAKKITAASWDSYLLPLPWSKAVLVIGEPLQLPEDISIEKRCRILEEEMRSVRREAEDRLKNIS